MGPVVTTCFLAEERGINQACTSRGITVESVPTAIRLKSDAGMMPIVQHFVNGATMRRKNWNWFDRFLHCAMLRIAPVEMTG